MHRREVIMLIGGAAAAWPAVCPSVAQAQQKERVRRIGILMPFPQSHAVAQARIRVFREELLRLGWSDPGKVQFDERWSTDNMETVRTDAASLVELNPDIILIFADRVIPVFMN
jgi:putative ABC transport system substrate-binding protein